MAEPPLLVYPSLRSGWKRVLTDVKFRWVQLVDDPTDESDDGNMLLEVAAATMNCERTLVHSKDPQQSSSNFAASETSTMEWVPAAEAVVDGCLLRDSSTTTNCLSTCETILEIQCQSLPDKKNWWYGLCQQLRPDEQVVQFRVRKDALLTDSVDALLRMSRDDLRRPWQIELDHGKYWSMPEWIVHVSGALWDPEFGLWVPGCGACIDDTVFALKTK